MSRKNKHLNTNLPAVTATDTPSVSAEKSGGPGDGSYWFNATTIKENTVVAVKKPVYSVVSIPNQLEMFTSTVNNFLNDGWQLQGGVSTSVISNEYNVSIVYSQAVYKMV